MTPRVVIGAVATRLAGALGFLFSGAVLAIDHVVRTATRGRSVEGQVLLGPGEEEPCPMRSPRSW